MIALIIGVGTAHAAELDETVARHLVVYDVRGHLVENGDVIVVSNLEVVKLGVFAGYVQGLCWQLLDNDVYDQVRSITMVNRYGGQGHKFAYMAGCKEIIPLIGTASNIKRRNGLVAAYSRPCRVGGC